ncbi:hypothetical protein SLA2020_103250 [Shorea laevis]
MAEVELTVSSAKDLKNVNWRYGTTRPYAVVWVDPKNKSSSKVDEEGDIFPYWDETLIIPLPGPIDDDTTLYIDIVHAGSEEDTKKLIGSARLRLKEVLNDSGYGERAKRTLQLKRPSGRPHGKIDVKALIREPRYRSHDAYYAAPYGVPPPSASRDYAAPPRYGNPYGSAPPPPANPYYQSQAAPPAGYQYARPYGQPQYGEKPYGQPQYGEGSAGYYAPEEEKKSKFGGMGTGLAVGAVAGAVAGALGGMALAGLFAASEDKIADDAPRKVEDDLEDDEEDDLT